MTEQEFEQVSEKLSESLSESESETGEESDEEYDGGRLETVQEKDNDDDGDFVRKKQRGSGKPPIVWFTSPQLPTNISLGIYNTVLNASEQSNPVEALKKKQARNLSKDKPPTYFLCLLGGGHFAAMIVSLLPNAHRQAEVLRHKTFHRYTTRRKQGGAQSASDAAKGAAQSAGSQIRRHNELALMQEIRDLLEDWKDLIRTSERWFVRAVGNTNRKVLFGYEGAVLDAKDERLRNFPFSTRRATQKEAMRCFVELTRVKVSLVSEESLATKNSTETTTTTAPAQAAPKKPPKIEKDPLEEHTNQITNMIKRAKIPALLSYLTTHSLSANTAFVPHQHHTPYPLHLASSHSLPAVVTALLVKAGADPTLKNESGKTAYEVAGDRATRDAFRVARGTLGEKKWAWDEGHVPEPLSKRQLEARERKEREEREKEAARRKEETEKLLQEEKEKGKKMPSSGGRSLVVGLEREMQTRGLSEEAKKKLERERRARAAEERIRKMQSGQY